MSKPRSASQPLPPRGRSSADVAVGGGDPPVLPSDLDPGETDPDRRRHNVLALFNAFAIVVVMGGGLWYASSLPESATGTRITVVGATLVMALILILIPPAYLGGWIDRREQPAREHDGDVAPPSAFPEAE